MRRVRVRTIIVPRAENCPECGGPLVHAEGCATCPVCGYSVCSYQARRTTKAA